jgi:DNA-directed RNA polymerase subunit RPC12/RpoP
MLSRTSRQEILRKLEVKVGYPFDEERLSIGTRQAITSLADFQRHLFVISEILNGEQGRVERSVILSFSNRLSKDTEIEAHAAEITKLQKEIDDKISEISSQIRQEENARQSGQPPPERSGGLDVVQLKCPTCGAALPMPTGRFVRCEYCGAAISIQDVSSQISKMIQSI